MAGAKQRTTQGRTPGSHDFDAFAIVGQDGSDFRIESWRSLKRCSLLAQPMPGDRSAIAIDVVLAQIREQAATAPNHLQEAAS